MNFIDPTRLPPVRGATLLEEPLSEGVWWTDLDLGGKVGRLKVDVVRVPCHDGFAAAWTTPHDKLISPIREGGRTGASLGIQLIRRVIESDPWEVA
jgi:hypothetical protein